ncbi:MAG TPA: hypothetical protein EYG03_30800 [Planctomycetes bacterium]|nr:hypothetical protein [Fuerstiella sp.]HIK96353.1 hypothetical protein [Planctomycetota bacterium]
MKLTTLLGTPTVLCFMAGVTGLIAWRVLSTSASDQAWSPTALKTPIQVQVVGHDFIWRFRFPGPDGKFNTKDDASVEKELHLPLERDVVFLVTSDDYVYTMAIPDLGLRQIAVPELTYLLEFRVTEERSIDIIADPLCGVRIFHDEDMGKVIVQSKTAFDSWYKEIQ